MRRSFCFAALALVSASSAACNDLPAAPSKPASTSHSFDALGPPAPLQADSTSPVTILRQAGDGRLLRVHGEFVSREQSAERAARGFLARHASLFELRADEQSLQLATTRQGLAGTYFRFQQVERDLPVFEAQVIVLVTNVAGRHVVRDVNLAHHTRLSIAPPAQEVGTAQAIANARAHVGAPAEDAVPEIERGIAGELARVVYRVRISASSPVAAWEVLVDADSGQVHSARDRIKRVTGAGMVFDPNPLATTGIYTFTDNNNITSAQLDAARFSVSLPNLDGSGFLRGPWVDARTKNANQRAVSATNTFNFDRSQAGFEQTMAYYHVDRTQTRFQALGIMNANARSQEVISDGQQGDNSYYDPQKLLINCGQGAVDDAEDADVVVHEYGHAVQDDQVPNYGAGMESGAMGEGFGDYLALTMDRTLSQKIDDQYCVASWDATAYDTSIPPCLRRADSPKHYPEHAVNQVHTDGEMWSAALFALDLTLGADTMTRLVLESHFSHSTTETFFGASQSILDTDANLFGGIHQDVLRRRFIQQGLSRILSTPSPLANVLQSIPVSIDNPRANDVYVNKLDDVQTFTYPGAQALRVHFTTIVTEADGACVGGGCDNVYLTSGLGDLYQIMFGNLTNVDSVVIPGDTVKIRLVADSSVQFFGYHVDRIDVIGDGTTTGAGGMGGMGGAGGMAGSGGMGGATVGVGGSGGMGMGGAGGMAGTGGMGGATVGVGGSGGMGMGGAGGMAGTGGMGGATVGVGGSGGMAGSGGMGMGGAGGESTEVGGGGGAGSTSSSSSSSAGGRPDTSDPGGCGCRTAGEESTPAPIPFGVAVAAASLAYRRRRKIS